MRGGSDVLDKPSEQPRLLPLLKWDEIKRLTAPAYLVHQILPAIGLIVVYGAPKCGKTFWLFDILLHIALGWAYRGRKTRQGSIVYCLFEGQTGFAARKEAFQQRYLPEDAEAPPFILMPARIELVKEHANLVRSIREMMGTALPSVIALDTLNRSFTGSESSDTDMTNFIRACDALREAFNCAVVLIHHCGLQAGRPRGHTALLGSADAQIAVTRDAAQNIIATVEYMKDGEVGAEIVSRLEQVDLIPNDDEETAATSCVIVPVDGPATASTAKTRRPLGRTGVVLRALEIAIEEAGEPAPASNLIPRTKQVVRLDLWKSYCERLEFADTDNPDSRLRLFTRERQKLQTLGFAGICSKRAWLIN